MSAQFLIPVNEVDRGHVHKEWSVTPEWLSAALSETEARPAAKPGRLTVSVSKSGRDFVVLGQLEVELVFQCARTLEPATYQLQPQLTLLLRRSSTEPSSRQSRSERHRTRAQKKEEDLELTDDDVATDTFSGDSIVLDDFVREQLLLEFPMVPLRSDLRSAATAAIAPAPEIPAGSAGANGDQTAQVQPEQTQLVQRESDQRAAEAKLDPRLAPLLNIANELAAKLKKGSE